jgi:hypothetical protein
VNLTHDQILQRLADIEQGLADRQLAGEQAAEKHYRLRKQAELEQAKEFIAAKGSTATERKANATVAFAQAELYHQAVEAEAAYEGWRAALRTLEARSMIGMALLKQSAREGTYTGPQPSWSGAN